MANIKTAISLPEPVFKEVEALAHEMRISCSRLIGLALEDYIRRHENQQLLERINEAYEDLPEQHVQSQPHQYRRRLRSNL